VKDAAGEEARYLKALFHTLRTGLVRLRDEILVGGKELVRFPRIWVLALSKADLLPEMDVDRFKALVLEKAADELGQLREAIESMVVGDEALAVGGGRAAAVLGTVHAGTHRRARADRGGRDPPARRDAALRTACHLGPAAGDPREGRPGARRERRHHRHRGDGAGDVRSPPPPPGPARPDLHGARGRGSAAQQGHGPGRRLARGGEAPGRPRPGAREEAEPRRDPHGLQDRSRARRARGRAAPEQAMLLLWATRGRTWGFRFLPVDGTGPDADPLPLYERAFSGHEDEDEGCWRTDGLLAVRLRDPEGRADEAGRVIPHELVLDGAGADGITSTADVVRQIWPLLAERYAALWDGPAPD